MNNFEVKILQPSGTILEIEAINGDNASNIQIVQSGSPVLEIINDVTLLPAEFNTLVNAQISSFLNAGSGIILSPTPTGLTISSSIDELTNVKDIVAGSGISVIDNSGIFTIATTGDFGLTTEQVDDRVASLIKAGDYASIVYNDFTNTLTIGVSGVQPSGDYSVNGHTHPASDIVSGTLDFARLPFTVTYPVRAVHIGGVISFNGWTYTISPTYYLNGALGDMQTIAIMNFPATSISVDVSESVTKYLNDYPGRTFTYASLEVVLIDAANRIVGWGTTASNPAANPSNGTAGTSMTINLMSFPSVPNNWIIGGLPTSNTNTVDILPITPYKKVASRWLDIEKYDWNNIVNPPPTYTPSSHNHGNITNDGKIGVQSDQIVITTQSGLLTTTSTIPYSQISGFASGVNSIVSPIYAPLNSPTFSGIPTVPTAPSGTNSTQIASTAFVRTEISNLVDSAPSTLDTLNELAAALNDDPNFATTIASGLGTKANLNGATFTGPVSGPSGNFTILQQSGIDVSVSGHIHQYTDIINFASGVDDTVSTLLEAGSYININYDSVNDTLTIAATGVQPSGDYSVVGHTHTLSSITDAGTAASRNVAVSGDASSSEVVIGSDTRLTNERTPTPHPHGLINNIGILASGTYYASGPVVFDVNFGMICRGEFGSVAGTVCQGNDSRLSDARIPTAHKSTHAIGGTDALTPTDIGAANASHTHTSSNITDFNSSVSGLLPVKDISAGDNISVSSLDGVYTVSATGLQPSGDYSIEGHTHLSTDISDSTSFGRNILTATSYEDQNYLGWTIVSTSTSTFIAKVGGKYYFPTIPFIGPPAPLTCTVNDPSSGSAGQFYHIVRPSGGYNSIIVGGTTYSASSGIFIERYWSSDTTFPPSGSWKTRTLSDYHNHTSSQITNFNSSVSGLLPSITGNGYISSNFNNNIYTISVSGLQPSGNYSVVGHAHASSEITDFNSSVSGLLPVTNILGGTNISVVPSGTAYTVSVSGQLGLTAEEVDDRVGNLLVAGSGISLDYNDGSDTLTIHNTSISPDEIEEYIAYTNLPASGNINILYRTTDDGRLYQWSGSVYAEIGPDSVTTGSHASQHYTNGIDPILNVVSRPATLTATVNNYAHNNADIIYLNADANRIITGLTAAADGSVKLLINSSLYTITLDHQDTNSNPENRFMVPFGSDYVLQPGYSITIVYDSNALRWRILA